MIYKYMAPHIDIDGFTNINDYFSIETYFVVIQGQHVYVWYRLYVKI